MESAKHKILIVEDESLQITLLKKRVEQGGYEVRGAQDAKSAIAIAVEWVPDIILLDVYLGEVSGIEVMEILKNYEELHNTLIVLMSADTSEDITLQGLQKEAHEFIYKPIRQSELLQKLRNWLKQKKLREELHKANQQLSRERGLLTKYFSADVVAKIISGELKEKMAGENIVVSVLFFDIRNFTSISESLEPHLVAEMLNHIFTDVMDMIFSYEGSVNKLIGDAILATFGCPVSSKFDALNSVKCALDIRETIKMFNQAKPNYMKSDVAVGMGIATGRVFAGNVGSFRRMEYTVIGDTVNLASRLQTLSKTAKGDLFIDNTTREKVPGLVAVKLADLSIRGKKKEIDAYSVDCIESNLDQDEVSENEITFF